jgi:hypothetical protein
MENYLIIYLKFQIESQLILSESIVSPFKNINRPNTLIEKLNSIMHQNRTTNLGFLNNSEFNNIIFQNRTLITAKSLN